MRVFEAAITNGAVNFRWPRSQPSLSSSGAGGRFARGSGTVRRGAERLYLSELEADDREVVLRYHYDAALRALPATRIERVPVPGDPVGFIRLVEPPRELVLAFHPERSEPRRWTPPAGSP